MPDPKNCPDDPPAEDDDVPRPSNPPVGPSSPQRQDPRE